MEEYSRTIWLNKDEKTVDIINQTLLPHTLKTENLKTVDDTIMAIKEMYVRGAPLIGATGAYGVFLAVINCSENEFSDLDSDLIKECERIKAARPTAVNLEWAVDRVLKKILVKGSLEEKLLTAKVTADEICNEEIYNCKMIGEHGLKIIKEISKKKNGETVNILTHCNAGWLACLKHGTATAPIYASFDTGIDVHVWVDETRPLNQGARLTAWELGQHGIKHTVVTDNAGGHLMQHGLVDLVIVGTDRSTYTGDVANKIGTYLKALAAKDNDIPFYVALPSSTFDWNYTDGIKEIPIEIRDPDEIRYVQGKYNDEIVSVLITPESSKAGNYAFDVTPARLVTGFITERGICDASEEGVLSLFPEKKN